MLIAERQPLAGLYPYMLWTTPGNQETKVMLIAERQALAGLYPYTLWTTPGNQETKVMLIAERQALAIALPLTMNITLVGLNVDPINGRRQCSLNLLNCPLSLPT